MSRAHDQKCFTILEVPAYCHELTIPQNIMQPFIVHARSAVQPADIPMPQSATLGLYPVVHKHSIHSVLNSKNNGTRQSSISKLIPFAHL